HWAYAGHGHTPGESWLAANIHRDIQHNRDHAREIRAEIERSEQDEVYG
ncbi:replication initiation protein, partial [Streptomyces sp. NPDC001876]